MQLPENIRVGAWRCNHGATVSPDTNPRTVHSNQNARNQGATMKRQLLAAALSMGLTAAVVQAPAWAEDGLHEGNIKHVLLISIDGLHALDVANYVKSHKGSALDELSEHGATFSNARTPANSDSFPGLLALVTGGSRRCHGLC